MTPHYPSLVSSAPGTLFVLAGGFPPPGPTSPALPIRSPARINILIPAGKGHGVVFGSGSVWSELLERAGGAGFRRRAMIGARRRSTT